MYLVEVKGDLIIRGGSQHSYDRIIINGKPLSQKEIEIIEDDYSPDAFNKKKRVVDGDLVLTSSRRAIPFATYLIHGDEIVDERYKTGESWVDGGVLASFAYWKESMRAMEEMVQADIPDICRNSFYNGLFVECFSALELLLCNVVFSLLYSNQLFFERAIIYWSGRTENAPKTKEEMEGVIHDFFADRVVYHRFGVVNAMFNSVFGFSLPDYDELKKYMRKRNNIVHRHSVSNHDWMTATNASVKDVLNLIKCATCFGNALEEKALAAL